jgi:hypothetical protein
MDALAECIGAVDGGNVAYAKELPRKGSGRIKFFIALRSVVGEDD